MDKFVIQLQHDFPHITFHAGDMLYWSPQDECVYYTTPLDKEQKWGLLHEVSHALLGHQVYRSDAELVQMEASAWHQAIDLGIQYGILVLNEHVQACLDTYRDWMHQRSLCPVCRACGAQTGPQSYGCLNCGEGWRVSASRFCRVYRQSLKTSMT